MKKIAIFASGSGSNAENIIRHFASNNQISVDSVFCNVADAYVLTRAQKYHIPTFVFDKKELVDPDRLLKQLQERQIDFIVLAGFLWLMPPHITNAYTRRIINIHPSLIPSFCGVGYYGLKVHEAALARGVKLTGATVHYVDEGMDSGPILLQKAVEVKPGDTPEILQRRVMEEAEWILLPQAIDMIANQK